MRRLADSAGWDLQSLIRPNVRGLAPYQSARDHIQQGILLDANENPYPRRVDGLLLNRYPDPNQLQLRKKLAGLLSVEPENVLAGCGSDEVLDWVFKVFCQPGIDRVAIAEPTYGMYRVMADIFGVGVYEFPLDDQFRLDAEAFLKNVPSDVKVLFLCSPNNPTGNLLDRGQVATIALSFPGLVVVDEAYIEFSPGPSLVADRKVLPNLLIMRTFSKAWGMAGLRVGYAVADAGVIGCFRSVKAPYNLSEVVMRKVLDILKRPQQQSRQVEKIKQERKRVQEELQRVSAVEEVFPSEANFLLFRCREAGDVCSFLQKRGVIIRDRSSLRGLGNCLRVSIGLPKENDSFLFHLREVSS